MPQKSKILIICGPTATGKTDLGIHLAKKFDGEIVFLVQWLVIGHWSAALSAGFGARMFISSFPLFSVGIAIFYSKIKNQRINLFIFLIFTIWNLILLNQFLLDKRLLEGQLSFNQIVEGQLTNLIKIPDKFLKR